MVETQDTTRYYGDDSYISSGGALMAKAPNLPTYLNSVRINQRASVDATDAHDSTQENETLTQKFLRQQLGSDDVES